MSASKTTIRYAVQLGGIGSLIIGAVLSVHHAAIAEQMGDVFAAAGFPRPTPADDDRIGGWMLMYQTP